MDAIATALYTALNGDTTLKTTLGVTGVYQGVAPAGATYPLVTFQLADGMDRRVFGASATQWTEWLIKGWDVGPSHKKAKGIADRVNALLDEKESSLSPTGLTVLCVRRVRVLPDMTDNDEGQGLLYRSSGARYEVEVRTNA